MTNEWSLRDEVLSISHRWPLIVVFCLAGSMIGFVLSYVWPSPHRATKELYVGLNIDQAPEDQNAADHAKVKFANVDDYKNWQMASLNTLIFEDDIINETLDRLRTKDDYWSLIRKEDLANMLHAYWRNAGKWRLVADSNDSRHASQAVTVWQDVVVDWVHIAVGESQKTILFDHQLHSLLSEQAQEVSRLAQLTKIRDSLKAWALQNNSASGSQPLNDSQRWLLRQPLDQAKLDSSWDPILTKFPVPDAPSQAYLTWIDAVLPVLDQEISTLQTQILTLKSEQEGIAAQYLEASDRSLGLSPYLKVDKITDAQPMQSILRPTGLLIFIGGAIGLIILILLWLARISLRART